MTHAWPPSLWESEEFRRMLAWSAGLHLALGVVLIVSPSFRPRVDLPAATYVNIVAAPPQPEPPAAKPAPAPAPPRQQVDEIVIPDKPAPLPKPKPKPEQAKPKPEPKPLPEKPAAPPAPSAEDLMASLREDAAARDPAPPAAGPATGAPGISDPERAAYSQQVHALLYQSWAGVQVCRSLRQPVARFQVQVGPSGRLGRVRVVQGSDSRHCDAAGERAIRRSDPFPPPPRGIDEVIVSFDPDVHF